MTEAYGQAMGAIERAKAPLIVVAAGSGADGYASGLGLHKILQKLEKAPTIVAADGKAPKNMEFLGTHTEEIIPILSNLRRFRISVDLTRAKLEKVHTEVSEDKLHIDLLPKTGFWDEKDVSFSSGSYKHDLIICVGAASLEACAHLYHDHPDFFFRTPIINIDHSVQNEHFGQYNLVDVTATACGEICHDFLSASAPEYLDTEIATHFLTGMIAKTKSFRSARVTPKTLQTASVLLSKGARRDEIIHHLYRTRTVETLRLWGRALARLKADESVGLVWSLLSQQDFLHAGASEEMLPDVIEELISSSPSAKVAVLLYEDRDKHVSGLIHATRPHDALVLTMPWKPVGTHEESRICFQNGNLVEVEKIVIGKLRTLINPD